MNLKESQLELFHTDKEIKGFFEEYRWLSNFHECIVHYEGLVYPSSENAYQAAKCKYDEDKLLFLHIKPNQSKRLGQTIELREDWEEVKLHVMYDILFDKFIRNKDLAQKLEDTGNAFLEETNYWNDTFWGVCKGKGTNYLGKTLMQIRKDIV